MKKMTGRSCKLMSGLLLTSLCTSCSGGIGSKQVAEITAAIPTLPNINIQNTDKFLNDLKLSPFWKVQKDRNGAYVAIARSVAPESPFDETGGEFLFELMAKENPKLTHKQIIHNKYLPGGDTFSSFSIEVVFQKPTDAEISFGARESNVALRIFDSWEEKIGPNSFSFLALKLSETQSIYLLLREQGADKTRKTTIQKLSAATRELKRIADLPEKYLVGKVYEPFMGLLFKMPLKDHDMGRFPGVQDRDTFYGYFKAQSNTSYEGINIKVSHKVYCPDEGTRKSSRLQKAEYVGKAYHDADVMFFLIEDNAVYLPAEYNEQFGVFSGKSSFDGTLEILNADGVVLLKTTEKFKGWER